MNGFNKVIIAGNLTRDPELRYTPNGTAIAVFGLAINRKWKDPDGNLKEDVTFVDVTAFGRSGETVAQYLKKGRPLLVEGRLKLDQWEDRNTQQKRSKLSVVCESFTFLDSGGQREGGDSEDQTRPARGRPAPQQAAEAPQDAPPEDDDVPF
jgi:single-strand DNA-binding protein